VNGKNNQIKWPTVDTAGHFFHLPQSLKKHTPEPYSYGSVERVFNSLVPVSLTIHWHTNGRENYCSCISHITIKSFTTPNTSFDK